MAPGRALVTGAGGFVGAVLARRLLAAGHPLTLLLAPGSDGWRVERLRDEARIVDVDLRDEEATARAVRDARPELVFHLAAHGAYSWQGSLQRMIATNLAGTANVVEAAPAAGPRAI